MRTHSQLALYLADVRRAGDCGAWYAALALALTLPDLCSACVSGRHNGGRRYAEWFDRYVAPRLAVGVDVKFDGKAAYALRCEFLHTGTGTITDQPVGRDSQLEQIVLTASGAVSEAGVRKLRHAVADERARIAMPVGDLCDQIIRGVERWYQDVATDVRINAELDRLLVIERPDSARTQLDDRS